MHLLFNNFVIFKIVIIDFTNDMTSIIFIKNLIKHYFFHYISQVVVYFINILKSNKVSNLFSKFLFQFIKDLR